MTISEQPASTHSLVLARLLADLEREHSVPEDALRTKIVLTTLDVTLAATSAPRSWPAKYDSIMQRLQSIGLDEGPSAAWTHELLRAAGIRPDEPSSQQPRPKNRPGPVARARRLVGRGRRP